MTLSAPGHVPLVLTVTSMSMFGLTTLTTAGSCGLCTEVPVTGTVPEADAVTVMSAEAETLRLSVALCPGLSAGIEPGTTPYWLSVTTTLVTWASPVLVTV